MSSSGMLAKLCLSSIADTHRANGFIEVLLCANAAGLPMQMADTTRSPTIWCSTISSRRFHLRYSAIVLMAVQAQHVRNKHVYKKKRHECGEVV